MKVIAKSLIKHNGHYYEEGDEMPPMTEAETARLVAARAVIVRDGEVKPTPPTKADEVKPDKILQNKQTEEVANLPISMTMKKPKLIGIARANGLTVDNTATPSEVYKMIKEYREQNGITIEDEEPVKKPEDKKNKEAKAAAEKAEKEAKEAEEAAKKEAEAKKDDTTPPGADSTPADAGKDK